MKIGVFDSGMGGVLAQKALQSQYPQHEFIGFFDHKNAPYGDKKSANIWALTKQGVQTLLARGCQLVLISCNTASCSALKKLQQDFPQHKILGCLIPTIEVAMIRNPRRLGLIGTTYTLKTKKYERELQKINPQVQIFAMPTPNLVPWIEAGKHQNSECRAYLERILQQLQSHRIDALILGCTHYAKLIPILTKIAPQLPLVDSVHAQVSKLAPYLEKHFL